MSIRLRMTLLYSGILALTLIAFSVILYAIQSTSSLRILENDLERNALRTAQGLERARLPWMRPGLPPGEEEGPARDPVRTPPATSWLSDEQLKELRMRDEFRLLDDSGTLVDLPLNQQGSPLPLSSEGLAHIQRGEPWVEIAPWDAFTPASTGDSTDLSTDLSTVVDNQVDSGRWLIYSQPVVVGGQVRGIVQVARSLADRDRTVRSLGITLIAGSVLTTLVAFGAGWLLSGATLQPIQRITQTAHAIGQMHDLSRRVSYHGPDDEVGRLARTFNEMLARLQEAYQRVSRALEMQRNFVADVSHELRTPLTTLRGNLALLGRQPALPDEERDDVVSDMVGETERLIRLVQDLLILARTDAGHAMERERVEVQPLIQELCRQVEVLEPGRSVVCPEPEGAAAVVAQANADALKQVLLILVDNALKHTAGQVRVTPAERDGQVTITVRDEGPGMPPELCERAFDRFYRGDASRSTPGFGLGLSIAKALTEAQGGTIAIESRVETGSTFTVTLPGSE